MELWVARRVLGNLEEWLEEIHNDLLEIVHQSTRFVDIKQTRDLNKPADVVREQLVVDNPGCKFVPLVNGSAVNGNSPLNHLVFARFQIRDDLFRDLGQVPAFEVVIRLEENGSQPGFSNWIVFKIELVESMKGVGMGL